RHLPVTLAILAITAAVAVWTGLGRNLHALAWLSFTPMNSMGQLAASPDLGQWWRLVSPIFMHFGIMHLAFNALWYWELGRRIELRSGSFWLLGLTLLFALVSNYAQWVFSGPTALFGGLSGLLCWGAVRAAGLLLAVPAAGAGHALRPAQGRGDHDARLAGVLFVGDDQRIGFRCYRQRRPCRRVGGGLHLRRHRRRNAADAG